MDAASSGARGRTRTGTPVKASGPKPGASTNFATRAGGQPPGAKPPILAPARTAIAIRAFAGEQAHRLQPMAGSRLTRNHAAYIAGSASSVSAVATISPPMMATAIGPQKRLRDSGIIA